MIITSECEECIYGIVNDDSKARIKIKCLKKNKEYYYGQCIPCDFKVKRREITNEQDSTIS